MTDTPDLPATPAAPAPVAAAPSAIPTVRIQAGRHKRALHGHPWVYSNEVDMDKAAKALPAGSVVRVVDAGGSPLGLATFNPHTLIAARFLTRNVGEAVDTGFFVKRLRRALDVRERLFDRPFYRLVHAESDGLPALIVDRYGDVVVVQANTVAMDRRLPMILEALDEVLNPSAIVLRNDSAARSYEGLAEEVRVAKGEITGLVPVEENGATFFADLSGGQKTGWFFDQRDNRAFIANLAKGRTTIDFYTYSGGFGVLAASRGAKHVTLVDRSAASLEVAMKAAEANNVTDRVEAVKGDAFNLLDRYVEEGRTWEVVICDPPAFVKSRKDLAVGSRAYRKMTKAAAKLVAPGGMLLVASCSHNMEPPLFHQEVARGLGEAGRQGRILRFAGAGPDHPVHPLLPETQYLKAMVFAVD
ncbi:class I SAM-dependent rRNA methyltransferase [Aerophototrophica crusticola]|uniref:Class I SAM-dependent rRNA methyltransferase n=1 Tax=Aerophototrophica crusticola TaxID=1709002 RepID=A0A858R9A7_9PROT|nr:class I SAM-dependent rRNA methyltransferase [Rhodospirillaceae bacterium B3]